MIQNPNPLKQYFRQPAIYLRLPSGGNFWPEGSIDLPSNGELPIYPMTAIDEITYRTPDALFNGQAVVSVIQSCVPNIKNAWHCPSADINAILTAIRIASYGHNLEIGTTCPNCGHEAEYVLDLRGIMDQLRSPDYVQQVIYGDLAISFKPMTYKDQTETSQLQFDEQKIAQTLPNPDIDEATKVQLLAEMMKKITQLTVEVIRWNIHSIRTPQAIVSDPNHIKEFLLNCDRSLFNQIRDHIIGLRESTDLKPMDITCSECSTAYKQPLTLDMANFFASAS